MMVTDVAGALALAVLFVVVAPTCLYLMLLTVAAFFVRCRSAAGRVGTRQFAVMIPAHDEEAVLWRLLTSLSAATRPAACVDVYVVADNCSDGTAGVAKRYGALVYERSDPEHPGKGRALGWLLDRIEETDHFYDAYVVLDADSVISANFFEEMDRYLDGGEQVLQAYYTVLPLHDRPAEALRTAALALVHWVRGAGKAALSLSCGLKGNGMCFSRGVVARFGWTAAGLTEDVEFHLDLVSEGIRVAFVPDAVVYAEMPPSLRAARTQNLRWEAGRVSTIRTRALPLLFRGIRERNWVAVDAAFEQLIPPLSVPVALALAVLIGGVLLSVRLLWLSAAAALGLLALHVLIGLWQAHVQPKVYVALLCAPLYVAWKVALYVRATLGFYQRRWVRTPRTAPSVVRGDRRE